MIQTLETNTADDLWRMADSGRLELVKGEVREMAPVGFDHGVIAMRFGARLLGHVDKMRLGAVVTGETGFRLSRNPDTVRAVDVGFVRADRIPASGRPERYFEGPPDLAVEVLSPHDSAEDVQDKVEDYLNAGTRMVLVLFPRRKTLTVYRPEHQPLVLRADETFEAGEVVPGFACLVGDLFA